jgi:branched-chain amino acid transport system ATP-binding protein
MTASASDPILCCRGVFRFYGALAAVNDLDFDLRRGEVLGIGGPNGAGKTTLLDLISGLVPVSRGSIVLDRVEISGRSPDFICQSGIARTFQLNASCETLTVRENVLVGAYFGRRRAAWMPALWTDVECERLADEAIAFVGLSEIANVPAANLPVLKRKLLMIASALATEPQLLLLDEPVGGLTPEEVETVMGIVNRLRESGVTIIVIEHVMRFLLTLSDRVIIMHQGGKIFEGTPQRVPEDPKVVEVYLGERLSRMLRGENTGEVIRG